MTLTGLVQNYSGLLAARFFLGKHHMQLGGSDQMADN